MKNLLIYISPYRRLNPEHKLMLEVQIDNSLDYWNKKDIIIATNFPYEYHGIKSLEVPDLINSQYFENPRAIINSKINVIIHLLENKLVTEFTWFHDFDAFQVAPLAEDEYNYEPKLDKDLGLVTYGIYPQNRLQPIGDYDVRINCGSIFFKPESLETFKTLLRRMDRHKYYEEDELTIMYAGGLLDAQIMNQTYNIGIRNTQSNVEIAEKPIKIVHFPPNSEWLIKMKKFLPDKLKKMLEARFGKILVTGKDGFIGSAVISYLKDKGYNVIGTDADVRDMEKLKPHFINTEVVIHTAAKLRKVSDHEYWDVNVIGTKNVVKLCIENGTKLIHFGTVVEDHTYGWTKRVSEMVVEQFFKLGLKALIIRMEPISDPQKLAKDIEDLILHHDYEKFTRIFKP